MVRNGKPRRGTNRARAITTRRIKRTVDRLEVGMQFVPTVDPPNYSSAPWWSITIVDNIKTTTSYKSDNIIDGLYKTLGFSDAQAKSLTKDFFIFKPLSIRVWGRAKQPIQLIAYDIVSNSTHRVKQMSDLGSGVNFSRLGWRFGVASKIDPLGAETVINVAAVDGDLSATSPATVYLQIIFCIRKGQAPTFAFPATLNMLEPTFEHLSMCE